MSKNNLFTVVILSQDKCYQYWPEKGCWMYGNVRVAMEDCIVLVDYTIRKFCVQYVSKNSRVHRKALMIRSCTVRSAALRSTHFTA